MNFSELRLYLAHKHKICTRIIVCYALLLALLEIGCMSNIFGGWDSVVRKCCYIVFCLSPLFLLAMSRRFTVNFLLLLFCTVSGLSLILNHPVANVMSVLRFSFFCGMLCLLSPLLDSVCIARFRSRLWKSVVVMVQLLVILSLILYIKTALFDGRGRLLLIVQHPILLSFLSGFTAVEVSFRFFSGRKNGSRWAICLDAVALVAAILVMFWGGSRSTVLAFIIAEIYLFIVFSDKWKRLRWLLLSIVAAGVLISLIGGDVTFRVKKKFEIGSAMNSIIFSREQLWKSRLEEFAEHPVLGIGFTNATRVSTIYDNQVVDHLPSDVREEAGSSWLSVLSNTGIIGFSVMAAWNLLLFVVVRRRRRRGDISASMYGGLLIFMIVCGCFEGWVLYGGSINFFLYWLLTSRIMDSPLARVSANKSLKGSCIL